MGISGDRGDNIEQAIDAHQQVLTVRTRNTMPVEWADTMHNLALAYATRIRGDHADNIDQAIEAFHQSLQVMTRAAMPVDWAKSMNNLETETDNRLIESRLKIASPINLSTCP